MHRPGIRNNAVSNVLGAILVIGLMLAVLSLLYGFNIPVRGENQESENIRDISQEYTTFSAELDSTISKGTTGAVSSMSFDLGTDSYFIAARLKSTGQLYFNPSTYNVTLKSSDGYVHMNSSGEISYYSQNRFFTNYWISYRWGMSSAFSSGAEGILGSLPFKVEDHSGDIYLSVNMVDLAGSSDGASGSGTVTVRTEMRTVLTHTDSDTGEDYSITLNNGSLLKTDIEKALDSWGIDPTDYSTLVNNADLTITIKSVKQADISYCSLEVVVV